MQKLRRIPFFDRSVVKEDGADVHPGIQKLSVSCACGAPEFLWFGDRGGEVRGLDRKFALSAPLQVFDQELIDLKVAQDGQRLVALGSDAGANGGAKYKIYDVCGDQPNLLVAHRIFPQKGPEFRTTCIAATSGLTMLAVGMDCGVIYLFRSTGLAQDSKPTLKVLGTEGDAPVTGIHFLEQGARTVLFVCNLLAIRSFALPDFGEEVRQLFLEEACGAAESCSCVLPVMNVLMVANRDVVFSYDPDEGNMSAMPLEGDKMILTQYKSYFICVTLEQNPNMVGASSSPSSMPKQNVTICLAYPHIRFIAYAGQFTDVTHVVPALGGVFVISRGGAEGNTVCFELHEKDLSEQLEILVKKRMFEQAAELAMQSGASTKATAEIYKEHGDALFAKRDYDNALAIYIKAVDLKLPLEPSYVVERYLDAQRIGHVARYLNRLHQKGQAEPEHTALLLKCYSKLKDVPTLAEFLEKTPVSQYDPSVVIEVLEAAGYHALAASVAQKKEVNRPEEYIRISLEHFKNYTCIVETIRELPPAAASKILLDHGKVLIKHAPTQTLGLIRELCGLKAGATATEAVSQRVHELLPIFASEPDRLEEFLRSLLLAPGGSALPPAETERLFPVLLELMVRSYCSFAAKGEEDSPDVRRLHAELMRLIQHYSSEASLASSLLLSQTYGFRDGVFHAGEKLGRYQVLMDWCFEHKDTRRLVEVCKRCGQVDQSLWVQALSFLAAENPAEHVEELGEVLRHIESSDLMPLLMVIETLQKGPSGTTLGDVRPYLSAQFKKLGESVSTSHSKERQDRQEIMRMQQEITSLRTQARTFQNTKCYQCGLALEVPAVHFFCGHSYHSYCVPIDGGCTKCSSEAIAKIQLREQREAQSVNVEGFFKYHQGSSGDEQIQAVGEWCKFGAFDAGAAHSAETEDPEM